MFDLALQPEGLPFSVALAVVALLALLQVIGLGDMLGADADVDVDVDVDGGMPDNTFWKRSPARRGRHGW